MPLRRGEGKKLSGILTLLVIFSISFAVLATLLPAVSADTDGIVTTDASVNPDVIGIGETTRVTLGASSAVEMETVPVDVMHVIDRSGSMGWETPTRLSCAKTAAKTFNGFLGSNDKVGLVSYSGDGGYIYGTTTLDKHLMSNIHPVNNAIDGLSAYGATDIGDGIKLATNEIGDNGRPEAIKVELLLTDGRANRPNGDGGICNPECQADIEYAFAKAQNAADNGIIIFTVGLGPTTGSKSINETMLQHIADITGGSYYHAPTGAQLQGIYDDISEEITAIASSTHAYYVLPDDIEYADSAMIEPSNITGNTLRWDIGDLAPGTPWTVSFDVRPTKGGDSVPINKVPSGVIYDSETAGEKALMTAGGCWILSPEDPAVKATFGFVVQQKEGEDPSGELEFQDHAIDLNLHSESIDTLTISGTTSTFSGTATVNGESGYWFEVYVEDNGKSGDVFQITITGPEVDYYAGGELAGGNIVIHSGGSSGFVPFPTLYVDVHVRPVANFTVSNSTPTTNQSVVFDAHASYDPDHSGDLHRGIVAYRWDFDGDGSWDKEVNYEGISHVYDAEGSYTAKLEVEDSDGLTNSTTRLVNVGGAGETMGNVTMEDSGISATGGNRVIGQTVDIQSYAEVSNTDVNTTADVIVKLYVDGVLLSQEPCTTLWPLATQNITVPTKWIPMSSGWHRIKLEARQLNEDGEEQSIGPTGDTIYYDKEIYIKKVKGKK
ncbi:MAG: post-COAP-1 domain-containing protein [Euryarchaeota archaeon]|nr:post-COAP-1 domain-containing protein [Euryarchaeota archaeon]